MSDVVVIGAGPAGISVAVGLETCGIHPVVVDRADRVAASWRTRYDRLRLNTASKVSHLPGRPFPKGTPAFPSRDEYVSYLEGQARGLDIRFGTLVERVDRDGTGWVVRTSTGDLASRDVVVATGHENRPVIPPWPGRQDFAGRLLHSAEYHSPDEFAGNPVLVVGPGCSGMEIAYDLVDGGAAEVWLAVRTPPNVLLRSVVGDVIGNVLMHVPQGLADRFTRLGQRQDPGDLTAYGLPFPDEGVYSKLSRVGMSPTIVDREVVEALKAGAFRVVGAVESLDREGVLLADGTRLEPAAVICATGYDPGLEGLVGHLDVLDDAGAPRVSGPQPAQPGLWFVGFVTRPGLLGYVGKEGRRVARRLAAA